MCRSVGISDRFFVFIRTKTREHLVEIYLMGIKFWTIYTNKFGLSSHGHATCAAHSRTIHHDGIEASICRDIVLFCGQCYKFHHNRRTDRDAFIHLFAQYHLLYPIGYQTFLSERTIIGHNDQFIRNSS